MTDPSDMARVQEAIRRFEASEAESTEDQRFWASAWVGTIAAGSLFPLVFAPAILVYRRWLMGEWDFPEENLVVSLSLLFFILVVAVPIAFSIVLALGGVLAVCFRYAVNMLVDAPVKNLLVAEAYGGLTTAACWFPFWVSLVSDGYWLVACSALGLAILMGQLGAAWGVRGVLSTPTTVAESQTGPIRFSVRSLLAGMTIASLVYASVLLLDSVGVELHYTVTWLTISVVIQACLLAASRAVRGIRSHIFQSGLG